MALAVSAIALVACSVSPAQSPFATPAPLSVPTPISAQRRDAINAFVRQITDIKRSEIEPQKTLPSGAWGVAIFGDSIVETAKSQRGPHMGVLLAEQLCITRSVTPVGDNLVTLMLNDGSQKQTRDFTNAGQPPTIYAEYLKSVQATGYKLPPQVHVSILGIGMNGVFLGNNSGDAPARDSVRDMLDSTMSSAKIIRAMMSDATSSVFVVVPDPRFERKKDTPTQNYDPQKLSEFIAQMQARFATDASLSQQHIYFVSPSALLTDANLRVTDDTHYTPIALAEIGNLIAAQPIVTKACAQN